MNNVGDSLIKGLREVAKSSDSDLHIQGNGSLFAISFTKEKKIRNTNTKSKKVTVK